MGEQGLEGKGGEPLDVKKVHYLVRLMKHYDLSDLEVTDGPYRVHLQRRGPEVAAPSGPPAAYPAAYAPAPAPSAAPRPEPAAAETSPGPKTIVIESPMVGTYYSSGSPEAPPFVSIGTAVQPSTTLCIIEAMKVFTDIPAGVSGTIAEILVKNGQSVEFGQPMFRVVPA
ncbi:acetyl-CoA carboxylase biotin carboxyl carrier protein [Paludisphaera mucosa]|uniref:Biotin carboxyl carrier protein of acetyl-CoA carboxylase n=1 Tax=Paludisphaera mucosa TaxID=3030827 RepID=A0ABT6FIS7_9BACT|nr:acetyl-CoA carboxylase biotin carboxyl carrier protein [Paludisphaera mucosa]MDG3007300.1 acetyl-CoA carboxylase biotin carboxyl carrier protein [Paludisphaera mucosa]